MSTKPSTLDPSVHSHVAAAEARIRATGERLTQPRVAVLSTLLAFDHAAAHTDVATALAQTHAIDRVTVYRVLDWLVSVGIAHRMAGDDRVWRFMLNNGSTKKATNNDHRHAHFTCEACGQTFCLGSVAPKLNVKVPAGFRTSEVDVKLRGQCAQCAAP
jgi:Fur family transcriptional regulator, ferric uptake regulator